MNDLLEGLNATVRLFAGDAIHVVYCTITSDAWKYVTWNFILVIATCSSSANELTPYVINTRYMDINWNLCKVLRLPYNI